MASIIPQLPARPETETQDDTLNLIGDPIATIPEDAVVYGVDIDQPTPGSYYLAGRGSPLVRVTHESVYDWTLVNRGLIWNSSSDAALAVLADNLDNQGTIIAETRGQRDAGGSAATIAAIGAYIYGPTYTGEVSTVLTNDGQIQAHATDASARGVFALGKGERFINNGVIAAESRAEHADGRDLAAFGLLVTNDAIVVNSVDGAILAEGSNAYAISIGHGSRSGSDATIDNAGRIEAQSTSQDGVAVAIHAGIGQGEYFLIKNTGIIHGDIAIKFVAVDNARIGTGTIFNMAGGVIEGDIVGTNLRDYVDSFEGSLLGTVTLNGGDDGFYGSSDANIVYGGSGDDRLYGYGGNDTIAGDSGNDILDGGDDADSLDGGVGDDYLTGGYGADTILGGVGNDLIYASAAAGNNDYAIDRIDGGDGDDHIYAGAGDIVTGGAGKDFLYLSLPTAADRKITRG